MNINAIPSSSGNAAVSGAPVVAPAAVNSPSAPGRDTNSTSTSVQSVAGASSSPALQPAVAVAPVAANQKSARVDENKLREATQRVQDIVQTRARNLEFAIDKDTDKTVIKLIDTETQKVLRQFPSEEMLKLSHALDEMLAASGLLIKGKA